MAHLPRQRLFRLLRSGNPDTDQLSPLLPRLLLPVFDFFAVVPTEPSEIVRAVCGPRLDFRLLLLALI